jgi:galactokinase
MELLEREIRAKFIELFNSEPLMVRSPGRINLIGEHTDYNDGFVMPAAIDKDIVFAIALSETDKSAVYSMKYDQQLQVNLQAPEKVVEPKWANFLLGVLHQMVKQGLTVKPFNCVFGGEVPLGAGLSSSAALECGFGFSLNELFHFEIPKINLIKMAQWAEHNFVGVKCGIMDQFASVMGKEDHVIVLDCRSLTYRYAPIDLKDYIIILCDTKVKHSLVDSEYNTRRSECETGVSILKKYYPQVNSLRDASADMVEKHKQEMPGKVYDRCIYVVGEINRVQQASRDLDTGNLVAFGKKMYETHEGLSKQYGVSCPELDFLVDEAKKLNTVLGARMMGGGFGGCTINIVKKDAADQFISHLTKAYRNAFSIDLQSYRVAIKDGTSLISKSKASMVNE